MYFITWEKPEYLTYRNEFCGKTEQLENFIKKIKLNECDLSVRLYRHLDYEMVFQYLKKKNTPFCFPMRNEFLVQHNIGCFTVTLITKAITNRAQYRYLFLALRKQILYTLQILEELRFCKRRC